MLISRSKNLAAMAFCACCLFPSIVFAEHHSQVSVHVRTVKATELYAPGNGAIIVDRGIGDLRGKLEKLQFRTYKLLSSESKIISLEHKEIISLPGGNSLAVRPLYMNEKQVGLWIKWKDKSGAEILDTRMHLNNGESIITGTDGSENSGIILAIDVNPVE